MQIAVRFQWPVLSCAVAMGSRPCLGLGWVWLGRVANGWRGEAKRGEENDLENRRLGPSCGATVSGRDWEEKKERGRTNK